MIQLTCLNCNSSISEQKYCAECGQKTDTHRITAKHFFTHDLLHGVLHIDRGMLFTAKEALSRPISAGLDYVNGKRIRYYNVFYFALLLIGLNLVISHYYNKDREFNEVVKIDYKDSSIHNEDLLIQERRFIAVQDFLDYNAKYLYFSLIPVFAVSSFLVFRRKLNLNFFEHTVLAGMLFLGVMLIITVFNILKILGFDLGISGIYLILAFFIAISYYRGFNKDKQYSKWSFTFRMVLFYFVLLAIFLLFALVILGYVANWQLPKINIQ